MWCSCIVVVMVGVNKVLRCYGAGRGAGMRGYLEVEEVRRGLRSLADAFRLVLVVE
jgi:hypothetical protein